jgi:hypothetical protein
MAVCYVYIVVAIYLRPPGMAPSVLNSLELCCLIWHTRLYRTTPVSYFTVLAYGGVSIYYFPSVCISYKVSMAQVPTPKLANQTHTPGESTDAQEHKILFPSLVPKLSL